MSARTMRPVSIGTNGSRREASWEIAVPPAVRGVRDLYQGVKLPVREHRVRVTLEPEEYASGKDRPMGRIYIYEY